MLRHVNPFASDEVILKRSQLQKPKRNGVSAVAWRQSQQSEIIPKITSRCDKLDGVGIYDGARASIKEPAIRSARLAFGPGFDAHGGRHSRVGHTMPIGHKVTFISHKSSRAP